MRAITLLGVVSSLTVSSWAAPFSFSTAPVTDFIGMASRPSSAGKIEIETGDDFNLTDPTLITGATFTGLLTGGVDVTDVSSVVVEIYRVFPKDSDTTRTINVPTRNNSPSDNAFDTRSSGAGLTFTTTALGSFTALNSVLNGINPSPGQHTGGEGSITGQEVQFDITFATPFSLPPDHYFFIPQVGMNSPNAEFFWLSGSRPIAMPGGKTDLQAWIRNENLAPDWLRVGTDIVGAGTFNGAFSLQGETVPEPSTLGLLLAGIGVLATVRRYRCS